MLGRTGIRKRVLAGIHHSGLDRLYGKFDDSLGLILTFHHVSDEPVPEFAPNAHLTVRSQFLDEVIEFLLARGSDIISLDEAHQRMLTGETGNKFAVLTFDDGYLDNYEVAYPVLRKHGVPFTIYVATGLIEKQVDRWWQGLELLVRQQDRIIAQLDGGATEFECRTPVQKRGTFTTLMHHIMQDVPEENVQQWLRELCWLYKVDLDGPRDTAMMSWRQVNEIFRDELCTIGSHTVNHPVLSRLSPERAAEEMNDGASVIESATGIRPKHFCFPYGSPYAAGQREFRIAEECGFKTAVTTRPGLLYSAHADHLTALPRISVNGLYQKKSYIAALLSGLPTRIASRGRKLNVD